MTYSMEELLEAQRQLDSLLRKLDRALATLESRDNPARCASQITLAKRRIRALEIARSPCRRAGRTAGPPCSSCTGRKGDAS